MTKKALTITSPESLDAAIAEVVRLKLKHKADTASMEAEKIAVAKRYAGSLGALADDIAAMETVVLAYCTANRSTLFTDKKSRETLTAVVGFELTPHRVETSTRKVKWKDVLSRLVRLPWGSAYIRRPASQIDKEALLADREKLTPEQCTAAGICFEQDEQFFIRPKSQVAEATVKEAK